MGFPSRLMLSAPYSLIDPLVQPMPDSDSWKSRYISISRATRMTSTQVVMILIVVVALVALGIVLFARHRSRKLRARFGPEYNRAVQEIGSKYKAEAELERLEKRVRRYPLRSLSPSDRDRFQESWREIQATFVDDPHLAFSDADQLLGQVMSACGYPMSDFEHRAAEVSVDHAIVVQHYRAGHEIAVRHSQAKATTEDLRQGMIHYRTLFNELMGEPPQARAHAAGRV